MMHQAYVYSSKSTHAYIMCLVFNEPTIRTGNIYSRIHIILVPCAGNTPTAHTAGMYMYTVGCSLPTALPSAAAHAWLHLVHPLHCVRARARARSGVHVLAEPQHQQ